MRSQTTGLQVQCPSAVAPRSRRTVSSSAPAPGVPRSAAPMAPGGAPRGSRPFEPRGRPTRRASPGTRPRCSPVSRHANRAAAFGHRREIEPRLPNARPRRARSSPPVYRRPSTVAAASRPPSVAAARHAREGVAHLLDEPTGIPNGRCRAGSDVRRRSRSAHAERHRCRARPGPALRTAAALVSATPTLAQRGRRPPDGAHMPEGGTQLRNVSGRLPGGARPATDAALGASVAGAYPVERARRPRGGERCRRGAARPAPARWSAPGDHAAASGAGVAQRGRRLPGGVRPATTRRRGGARVPRRGQRPAVRSAAGVYRQEHDDACMARRRQRPHGATTTWAGIAQHGAANAEELHGAATAVALRHTARRTAGALLGSAGGVRIAPNCAANGPGSWRSDGGETHARAMGEKPRGAATAGRPEGDAGRTQRGSRAFGTFAAAQPRPLPFAGSNAFHVKQARRPPSGPPGNTS
jgi:hypothetical protein